MTFIESLRRSRHRDECFVCFTWCNAAVLCDRRFHTCFPCEAISQRGAVTCPRPHSLPSADCGPGWPAPERPAPSSGQRSQVSRCRWGWRGWVSAPVAGGGGGGERLGADRLWEVALTPRAKEQSLEVQKTEWVSLAQPLKYLPELCKVPAQAAEPRPVP